MCDSVINDLRERVIKAREDHGEAAKIISDFEPLVKKCIGMYIKDPGSFEDAMQEGRLAILGCIKKYDTSSPANFEGYVKINLELHRVCGVMTESSSCYENLHAEENLIFFGRMHGMEEKLLKERTDFILKRLELFDVRNRKLKP